MHHEYQNVLVGLDLEKLGAQRHLGRHVEACRYEVRYLGNDLRIRDRGCSEVHVDISRCNDLLVADAVDLGVDRAQNLVTADNVGDRLLQPRDVQFSGESYRNRDVVPCRARIQLVEEPHALLRQRQRHPNRTHLRSQRRT